MPQDIPRTKDAFSAVAVINPETIDAEAMAAALKKQYPDNSQIDRMLTKDPALAVMDYNLWKTEPFANDLINTLLKKTLQNSPEKIFYYYIRQQLISMPNGKEWFKYAAGRDAATAFANYKDLKDLPYAHEIFQEMAKKDPAYCLTYAKSMIDKEKKSGPGPYQTKYPYIHLKGKDGFLATALKQDLGEAAETKPFYMLFAYDLYKNLPHGPSIREIALQKDHLIAEAEKEPAMAFEAYRFFRQRPYANEILSVALENAINQKDFYAVFRGDINEAHDENHDIRYSSVDNDLFDAEHLYNLLATDPVITEEDHLYTSSYRGVFDLFLKRVDQEHISLLDFLQDSKRSETTSNFMEGVITYRLFSGIYKRIPENKRGDIIAGIVEDVVDGDVKTAALAADLVNQTHDKSVLQSFEKKLAEAYENTTEGLLKDRLGLLASSYAKNHKGQINYPEFFDMIENNPQYKIRDMDRVEPAALYDAHGRNIQLMTFYKYHDGKAEPDGQASYDNFIKTYKNAPDRWRIEDKGSYVHISSLASGKQVHIYANKPEYDGTLPGKDGIGDIATALEKVKPPITDDAPLMLIHRGHSYHLDKTLKYLGENSPIVYLGSCGGSTNIEKVLKKSPDAHIIVTSQEGTMQINDPLLFYINDKYLRLGKPVVWDEIWKRVNAMPDSRKDEYIKPSDNTVAAFTSSYYKLHPDEAKKAAENQLRLENRDAAAGPQASVPLAAPAWRATPAA